MELPPGRLRALPVQIIEIDSGMLLKRGVVETSVRGTGAVEAVRRLLGAASGAGMPAAALRDLFAPAEHADVEALIEHLRRRGMLVTDSFDQGDERASDSPADVFYWHFGVARKEVDRTLADRRVVVVGLNGIARQLRASLASCGVTAVSLVDDPLLRNPELFDLDGLPRPDVWPPRSDRSGIIASNEIDPGGLDCLVAISEFGATSIVARWNEFCVLHKRPFLPVVLKDLVGSIGPLVIPGETACYECARMRQRTHQPDPYLRQAIEAATGQGGPAGFLPPMSSMLGEMAALELVRFFCLDRSLSRLGTLIELSVLARDMTPRPVLKLPRCPVCTPIDQRPDLTPLEEPALAAMRGDR
jgi:bacteriocin biosynthesis cyclodehydratase domain-containing protein